VGAVGRLAEADRIAEIVGAGGRQCALAVYVSSPLTESAGVYERPADPLSVKVMLPDS
jgi:hypothetical protein